MGMWGLELRVLRVYNVHGEFGFGNRNVKGEMILEFADALNFVVANTWFKGPSIKYVTLQGGGALIKCDSL